MFIPIKSVIFKSVVTWLKYSFSQMIWKLLRIWTNAIKKEKNLKLLKPEPCKDEVEKHDWDRKRHPRGEGQSREGTKVLKKRRNGFWSSTINWREGGLPCWGFQVQPGLGGSQWQHQCRLGRLPFMLLHLHLINNGIDIFLITVNVLNLFYIVSPHIPMFAAKAIQ